MDTPEKSGAIAFICAMPMELSPLVKKLSLTKTVVDGVTVHRGTLDGREVVAIVTGMGTKLATEATERLLDATSVDRVMVVGIAGALENETPIGTLMLPEVVVNSATGTEYRPEPLGEGTRHGKMSTGDTLQTDPDDIAELRAKGVVSLEMETAAIAEICERRVEVNGCGLRRLQLDIGKSVLGSVAQIQNWRDGHSRCLDNISQKN